jgi:hypothetical protein
MTQTTDRDGRVTSDTYDRWNRQITETWVGASPAYSASWTYDAAGQLTVASDSNGTYTLVTTT